jgi:hypothetical protein
VFRATGRSFGQSAFGRRRQRPLGGRGIVFRVARAGLRRTFVGWHGL